MTLYLHYILNRYKLDDFSGQIYRQLEEQVLVKRNQHLQVRPGMSYGKNEESIRPPKAGENDKWKDVIQPVNVRIFIPIFLNLVFCTEVTIKILV